MCVYVCVGARASVSVSVGVSVCIAFMKMSGRARRMMVLLRFTPVWVCDIQDIYVHTYIYIIIYVCVYIHVCI